MKFFALIMAGVVLALSLFPCTDAVCAARAELIKTEFAKQLPAKDNEHKEECSPFCHCSCCAGFSINHWLLSISPLPSKNGNNLSVYITAQLINISIPVWQPPKL
jgi:hypothetical protein